MGREYSHLGQDERLKLAAWRDAKMPVAEIALRLGRSASTLYRELRRNWFVDDEIPWLTGYHGVTAQRMSDARRGEDGPDARSVRRIRLWSNHMAQCGHALPLHPVPLCLLLHERRGGPVDYMGFGKITVCWSGQRVFRVPATGAALATCRCSGRVVERHRPACPR